jgi:hypothetical protein
MHLPERLTNWPAAGEGQIVKVMLHVIQYLRGPTVDEFDDLLDLYWSVVPKDRLVYFTLAELPYWSRLDDPKMTNSAISAARLGRSRPEFEAARRRIREGRGFSAQVWDGLLIQGRPDSWSMNFRRVHRRSEGLHSFVRFLMPISTSLGLVREISEDMANRAEFYSGTAGLVFAYDPERKAAAFDQIYSKAKQYWGVEIEDLNLLLRRTRDHLPTISWINQIGYGSVAETLLDGAISELANSGTYETFETRFGRAFLSGFEPSICDRHRPDPEFNRMRRLAGLEAPLLPLGVGEFEGERFGQRGATDAWLKRFVNPEGW